MDAHNNKKKFEKTLLILFLAIGALLFGIISVKDYVYKKQMYKIPYTYFNEDNSTDYKEIFDANKPPFKSDDTEESDKVIREGERFFKGFNIE